MNAQEQLAEMAATKAKEIAQSLGNGVRYIPILTTGKSLLMAELEDNNRAVLRWFAEEVERRANGRLGPMDGECALRYMMGSEMTELLRDLGIQPQCSRCGSEAVPFHTCKGEEK